MDEKFRLWLWNGFKGYVAVLILVIWKRLMEIALSLVFMKPVFVHIQFEAYLILFFGIWAVSNQLNLPKK